MYVTLKNGIEILVDMETVEPAFDYSGVNINPPELSYPPELSNEDELECAIENVRFWLWDEGILELPSEHRYSEEALQLALIEMGW